MNPQDQKNPHLADLFRTAIAGSSPAPAVPATIVVTGSNNVISWGGTVYVMDPRASIAPEERT